MNWIKSLSNAWKEFIKFCKNKDLEQLSIENLIKVCQNIEEDHKWRKRRTWRDYVEHLYDVTKNYINISNPKYVRPEEIYAALNHDNIEDIKHDDFNTISECYWEIVALLVQVLSKHTWIKDDKTKNKEFFWRFQNVTSLQNYIKKEAAIRWIYLNINELLWLAVTAIKIKWCDRKHNLATEILLGVDVESGITRTKCKIDQTIDNLLPWIKQIGNKKLLEGINQVIEQAREDIDLSLERFK